MAQDQRRNSGFLNFTIEPEEGTIVIGGNMIDRSGKKLDLGFARGRVESIEAVMMMIAAQLKLALQGKTMLPKEKNDGKNKGK